MIYKITILIIVLNLLYEVIEVVFPSKKMKNSVKSFTLIFMLYLIINLFNWFNKTAKYIQNKWKTCNYGEIMNKFAFLSKFIKFFKQVFSDKKKTSFLILIIAVAIIFVSTIIPSKNNEEGDAKIDDVLVTDYASLLEAKVQNMLVKLDEVNSVSVMVMTNSTEKIEYLIESEITKNGGEENQIITSKESVVFDKNGSSSSPVIVTKILPKITGVLIVVNNISASTKLSILNSISVVLNVDASCISIIEQ